MCVFVCVCVCVCAVVIPVAEVITIFSNFCVSLFQAAAEEDDEEADEEGTASARRLTYLRPCGRGSFVSTTCL